MKRLLENPTDESVEIVEAQYGDYLGEDDFVRYKIWTGAFELPLPLAS